MRKISINNKKRIRTPGIGKNHIKSRSNPIPRHNKGPMANRFVDSRGNRRPGGTGYYIKDRVTLPPSNNRSTARNLKERLSIIGVPGPHRNIVRDGNKIPPHKMRINKIVKGTRVLKSKRRL